MTAQAKASHEAAPQNRAGIEDLINESRKYYFSEVTKAWERIARLASPSAVPDEAALRWALEFASLDLSRCSEGRWSDCRYEVDYVARQGPFEPDRTHQRPTTAATWPHSPDPEECEPQLSIRHIEIERLPSKSVVREIQRDTQRFLDSVIAGEEVELTLPSSQERLTVIRGITNGEAFTRLYRFLVLSDLAVAFRHHLLGILAARGQTLRSCLGCSTRFVADRRNKEYCDPLCRNLYYMRRKRNVPPERYGKRGRPHKEAAVVDERKITRTAGDKSGRRTGANRNRLGQRIASGIMNGTISAREGALLTRQLYPKKGR